MTPYSGNVTFLFTDIEGSTRLVQDHHFSHRELLAKHHSILQESVEYFSGFVFQIIGDAFCCSFENSVNASMAALRIQQLLVKEDWGEAEVRVRIGLHKGYAEWNGNDYMGYLTLARANRIMSCAHGGQVVASLEALDCEDRESFLQTVSKGIGANVTLKDLGERRLKDLIEPLQIFQLVAAGLQSEFPPIKSLDARPNNLPQQLSSFIGREKEISEIRKLAAKERMITLLGPGGTGKTRLALQSAAELIDEFSNGVWFCDLAPLSDPQLVCQSINQVLGLNNEGSQSSEEILIEYLREKDLLLIFDNCEHLVEECSAVSELVLSGASGVKVIATSRESLRCSGEAVYRVSTMAHPSPEENLAAEELAKYESARLFIERALTVNRNFRINDSNAKALSQICAQLDGIPLAIELAAARTKLLSVHEIHSRLSNIFGLLTGGKRTALPRQKTLRAMIDWSHDLLSENEKVLWRRLAVFSGGWFLEDAENVCSDELIDGSEILDLCESLGEKSVIAHPDHTGKFSMLETIRQYGLEKLDQAGESESVRSRHLKHYLAFCETGMNKFFGPALQSWVDSLEAAYPNVQSALKWSWENKLFEEGNRLAVSLGKFWEIRGHVHEGKQWMDKLLSESGNLAPELKAASLKLSGILHNIMGEHLKSIHLLEESLSLYRSAGNMVGTSQALNILGLVETDVSRLDDAYRHLSEGLELKRQAGAPIGICSSLNSLGLLVKLKGNYELAKEYFTEALSIAENEEDEIYIGILYNNLAELFHIQGRFEKAEEYFRKGYELDVKLNNKTGMCISLANLGVVHMKSGEPEKARECLNESYRLSELSGLKAGKVYSLIGLADLMTAESNLDGANEVYCRLLREFTDSMDAVHFQNTLVGLAIVRHNLGENNFAARLIGAALAFSESVGSHITSEAQENMLKLETSLISVLGEEEYSDAKNSGRGMNLKDDICQLAI